MSWSEAGAGQAPLPYPDYIDLVTKRYFDGVDNKQLDRVLDCFTEDAILTEGTSNTVHSGRDTAIRAMFVKLFNDFASIWHGNFVHTADPQSNSVNSQFKAKTKRGLTGNKNRCCQHSAAISVYASRSPTT